MKMNLKTRSMEKAKKVLVKFWKEHTMFAIIILLGLLMLGLSFTPWFQIG